MGIHKASYNQLFKKMLSIFSRKINCSMRRQNKKDLHIHAQQNEGCSMHPDQFVLYMYV